MAGNKKIIHFIDTETTGLDLIKHEIISIGIVSVKMLSNDNNIEEGYEILSEQEYKIKPDRLDMADPVAFQINKFSPELWQEALTKKEASEILNKKLFEYAENDFAQKINKIVIAGHNVHFDVQFLSQFFIEQNLSWMPRHIIDTYSLSKHLLAKDGIILESYGLHGLCEYYGIENKAAHTALADARACFEIYKKLTQLS